METKESTITVETSVIKKQSATYTIYAVTTKCGQTLDTFDKLDPGKEYKGTIVPNSNPQYNSSFKLKKDDKKFGAPKDYTFEKRRVALECTVSLIQSGSVEVKNLESCRDKFFTYLNEGK
jgi:hypothetical protein